MSLKTEIGPYLDKNGYVNPYPVDRTQGRQCDNATMYSSEYHIILAKRQEDSYRDADEWLILIDKASIVPGLTVRYPGDTTTDAPDNLYGILAASKVLKQPRVAEDFLAYGYRNFGFYNPSNPEHIKNKDGSIDWSMFQWRQLQLVFAAICASGRHSWWKIWNLPLAIYTALVIGISCIDEPYDNSDPRRLAWLLIQATEDSFLCRLASKIWYKRLYKIYPKGMNEVAGVYYQPSGLNANPFSKYWSV